MRIGLLGSHGTGKTSVAELFSAQTGTPLVTSASRRVRELGYPINQQATCESQAATSMGRLAAQVAAGDHFISDRTLLDSMAYNKWQLETLWQHDPKAHYWYDTMDIITERMMHEYDILVYVPITFSIVADGVRATEEDYQAQIDEYVLEFIHKYQLFHYTMPKGSVEARVEYVKFLTDSIT